MTWKTKFDDEKLSLSMNMPRVSEIYILEIPKKIIENRKSNASKSLFFTILCLNWSVCVLMFDPQHTVGRWLKLFYTISSLSKCLFKRNRIVVACVTVNNQMT